MSATPASPVICVVDGRPVTLDEIAPVLKVEGRWPLVNEAVREAVLDAAASAQGITVADDEVQQAANAFRTVRKLFKATDMLAWLDTHKLKADAFESGLERGLKTAKLRAALDHDEVRRYFFDHLKSFQWVRFSQLVAAERETAVELLAQVHDGEVGFASLARRHSIDDDTKLAGGYAGTCKRSDLAPALEALVFSAPLEEVSGPLETRAGWYLVKVWERGGGELDAAAAEVAREAMFAQWLQRQIDRAKVEVRL